MNGCAIRRSRANAVQEYARLQDMVSKTCGTHRPANGLQGPQNAGEEIGTNWTAPEQSKCLRKL